MANQQKIDTVAQTTDRFKKSQGVYFTKYTGMSVPQITTLRKAFSNNGLQKRIIHQHLGFELVLSTSTMNHMGEVISGH